MLCVKELLLTAKEIVRALMGCGVLPFAKPAPFVLTKGTGHVVAAFILLYFGLAFGTIPGFTVSMGPCLITPIYLGFAASLAMPRLSASEASGLAA